jgi:hypothetical protein
VRLVLASVSLRLLRRRLWRRQPSLRGLVRLRASSFAAFVSFAALSFAAFSSFAPCPWPPFLPCGLHLRFFSSLAALSFAFSSFAAFFSAQPFSFAPSYRGRFSFSVIAGAAAAVLAVRPSLERRGAFAGAGGALPERRLRRFVLRRAQRRRSRRSSAAIVDAGAAPSSRQPDRGGAGYGDQAFELARIRLP